MSKEIFKDLCYKKLIKIEKIKDKVWTDRTTNEMHEVITKGDIDYFLKTRQECLEQHVRYENEHNSIIPYLLDICSDFDISKKVAYDYGEFPDIDIDYIDGVREYLKEEYAKECFGEDYVCNIANYNTFGIKLAMKDVARIFGGDHEEVEDATRAIKDKDEDRKPLTWEQTLDLFDDFRDYCERNPQIADAAKRMVGRIRGLGQHASGLVVSSVPIREYVPLIRGKEGLPASSWIEGLHGTDLSTVGFIKFDFLGLDGNSKIATTCKLACEAKKQLKIIDDAVGDLTVCAKPGVQSNGQPYPSWSDISYLDDKKALDLADKGALRMIFQFDGSPGIRAMAKEGGVTSFDDLVAYTALYRPGPMKLKYHERYINRKRGKEEYAVHPLLAEGDANLSFTYGVLTYQEQISRLLNTIGKVPWADCDVIRKSISKKKIEKFQKYKDDFIIEGQITLGESKEYLEHLWDQIEAFAGYGFNLSHAVGYTYLSSRMLWLKAHLPHQFFASMFTHTKASGPKDYNKLKEYKREAKSNGVKMAGLDINKSKKDFVVNEDGIIYYGFGKIKGIGEEVAARLEELQPYTNFEDFLQRFGTQSDAVKAVIALECFKDRDPITLYKFYEHFKDYQKKENDRIKRFKNNKAKLEEEILELRIDAKNAANERIRVEEEIKNLRQAANSVVECYECGEVSDSLSEMSEIIDAKLKAAEKELEKYDDNLIQDKINKLNKKLQTCIANKEKKDEFVVIPKLDEFDPSTMKAKLNEKIVKLLETPDDIETELYGYVWQHPLEKLEGYEGHTFNEFLDSGEKDGIIEIIVRQVQKKQGAKAEYYSLEMEDATGYKRYMTVWKDDYERFQDELTVGQKVRLWVDTPSVKYRTFTLHAIGTKWKKPPKQNDYRVRIIK